MALTVGEIEAVLRLRDEMTPILKKIGVEFEDVAKTAERSGKDTASAWEKAEKSMNNFAGSAAKAGVALSAALTVPIMGLATAALGSAAAFEQTQTAFRNLLGSAEKGNAMLKEMEEFAAATPFQFDDLTGAALKMKAFGFETEQILPTLHAVGDAAATMGAGAAHIDRILLALGQMKMKGTLSGEEMRQLTEANINPWKYLADEMGKTIPEVKKMAQKGAIDANAAIAVIIKGMGEQFKGMMKDQSETMMGKWSTVKDNMSFMLKDIGTALLPVAKMLIDAFNFALPYVQKLTAAFAALSPQVKMIIVAIGAVAAGIGPALLAFAGLSMGIGAIIAAGPILLPLLAAIAAGIAVIAAAWFALGGNFQDVTLNILAGIGMLSTGFTEMKLFFVDTATEMEKLSLKAKAMWEMVKNPFKADEIGLKLKGQISALEDASKKVKDTIKRDAAETTAALTKVAIAVTSPPKPKKERDWLKELADAFGGVGPLTGGGQSKEELARQKKIAQDAANMALKMKDFMAPEAMLAQESALKQMGGAAALAADDVLKFGEAAFKAAGNGQELTPEVAALAARYKQVSEAAVDAAQAQAMMNMQMEVWADQQAKAQGTMDAFGIGKGSGSNSQVSAMKAQFDQMEATIGPSFSGLGDDAINYFLKGLKGATANATGGYVAIGNEMADKLFAGLSDQGKVAFAVKEISENLKTLPDNLAEGGDEAREIVKALYGVNDATAKTILGTIKHNKELDGTLKKTFDWKNALIGAVQLAGMLGGKFGEVAQVIGNIGDDWDRISKMEKGKAKNEAMIGAAASAVGQLGGIVGGQGGAAMQGAASGAALGLSVAGPWGAAVGAVVGGVMGWLKGGKVKKAAKEAGAILGRTVSQEQAKAMMDEAKALGISVAELAKKMRKEEVEAAKKQRDEIITAGLEKAAAGVKAWSGKLQGAAEQQGRIYAATFAAMVAENGILAAVDAMKDSLEEIAKISPQLAADIRAFSEPGHLRDAAEAAKGLADTLVGLTAAGYMNAGLFADFGATAQAAFAQAQAGGATQLQALQAIAPLLAQMKAAADQYGFTLDANTQSLIEQAEANGIVFKTDPMLAMLDVLVEIAKVLGADIPESARRAAEALSSIPAPNVPEVPGEQPKGGPRSEETQPEAFAGGTRGWRNFGKGRLAVLHGTEAVVRPGDVMPEGLQVPPGAGGGTIVNLHINENPLQTAQTVEQMRRFTMKTADRELARNLSDQIARGKA